jgi:hypothetical protein
LVRALARIARVGATARGEPPVVVTPEFDDGAAKARSERGIPTRRTCGSSISRRLARTRDPSAEPRSHLRAGSASNQIARQGATAGQRPAEPARLPSRRDPRATS